MRKTKNIRQSLNGRHLAALCILIGVVGIGTYLIVSSLAATPFTSLEPENGALNGNVSIVSDANTSGGKYVTFNTSSPSNEKIITTAYTTGYTYFDNTPPGSAIIAFPHSEYPATAHNLAGGIGTYNDPITLAIGHSIINGIDYPDYTPGTRFYLADIRKYAIVEDTCGDGSTPQNIPCHKYSLSGVTGVTVWVDMWIGGSAGDNESAVDNCASIVTDGNGALHTIIQNPASNYVVYTGAVYQNGFCIQPGNKGFGNTLVKQ